MIHIGIIQFPGSNCERETRLAVKRAGMQSVDFLWNENLEKLSSLDGYIIVGGFSYEDRSRAGVIAAHDPLMTILKEQSLQGKPILGICNGAQILVEAGLVPGLENHKVGLALTENKRMMDGEIIGTGYYNAWIHLRLAQNFQRNAFTQHIKPGEVLRIPVAHGEGRFVLSPALKEEIAMQGLAIFQYCDEAGRVDDSFPINPNGSMLCAAAIANKAGNVLAMMPHPERTTAGDAIFSSMREYIESKHIEQVAPLAYYPRYQSLTHYQLPVNDMECLIELNITDNHALTVQQTLHQLGIKVSVTRKMHWQLSVADEETYQAILKSEVLFNPRKERLVTHGSGILVRSREDIAGLKAQQNLKKHFNIKGLNGLKHGVLWQFAAENVTITDLMDETQLTQIIANPYAHECYRYHSILR